MRVNTTERYWGTLGLVLRKLDRAINRIKIFSIALKLPVVWYNLAETLVFLNGKKSCDIVKQRNGRLPRDVGSSVTASSSNFSSNEV